MLETHRLKELFQTLRDASRITHKHHCLAPGPLSNKIEKLLLVLILLTAITLLCLIVISEYGSPFPGIADMLLAAATAIPLLSLIYLIKITATGLFLLWSQRKAPFTAMASNSQDALLDNAVLLKKLWSFNATTLSYILLHYRDQWTAFDNRVASLTGDIRKLGLIPALTALFFSALQFSKENDHPMLWAVVIGATSYYLLAFFSQSQRPRPDQIMAVLNFAIEHHPDKHTSIR